MNKKTYIGLGVRSLTMDAEQSICTGSVTSEEIKVDSSNIKVEDYQNGFEADGFMDINFD